MMKTIKELAEELGISRQGLSKRIDALGYREQLLKTSNGLSVSNEIETAIRNYFQPNETKSNLESNDLKQDETKSNQMQLDYETIYNQMKLFETENNDLKAEVTELNHRLELKEQAIEHLNADIESLNRTIAELKADKADLQQHRDNLTSALTLSKSDLARLENIITQMAALPLGTRIFGWSGAVQQLTDMSAEEIEAQDQTQTVVEIENEQQDTQIQE